MNIYSIGRVSLKKIFALILLASSSAFAAQSTHDNKPNPNAYHCGIANYDFKKGFEILTRSPLEIERAAQNQELPGKPTAIFQGIQWFVNYYDQKFSVEVRDAKAHIISISTVAAGESISVELPFIHQILVCNKEGVRKALYPSLKDYSGVKAFLVPKKEENDYSSRASLPRDI